MVQRGRSERGDPGVPQKLRRRSLDRHAGRGAGAPAAGHCRLGRFTSRSPSSRRNRQRLPCRGRRPSVSASARPPPWRPRGCGRPASACRGSAPTR
jgi:hypothetical protein